MSENPSPKPTRKEKPPEHVIIYFDVRDGSYWYQLKGRFVALKKSDLFMHLRADGLRDTVYFDGQREIDWPLYMAQCNRMIDYAGALAGHRCGTFSDGSQRKYLITDEASGVFEKELPKEEPKFFSEFIFELLPEAQAERFLTWLNVALRSLRRGDFRPGQVVVLAGPAGCGKSLLQAIITELLGGRSASPFRYMMELTQFNKDLCGAEHWQIEDPATTTDIRTRRAFGAKLKEATVNRDFSIHAKGKDALTLPIFRRVTISVNDEPENLAVVPPLDPSIEDKVFLFHCAKVEKAFEPFRDKQGEIDRAATWEAVKSEIAAIRGWILREFKNVPKAERDDRFGLRSWHHPALKAELTSLAPETKFLQLLDDALFSGEGPHSGREFKSSELEKELRKSEVAFEVEKILRYVGACGSYLGKLHKSQPHRVSKRVNQGTSYWTINPPEMKD
jgi:energy-coupling factor transporter ATP-binding protein EcfA2